MIRRTFIIDLKEGEELLFVPVGDIHWDTPECDRERFVRFVEWVVKKKKQGKKVRIMGHGDYLDFESPSERKHIGRDNLHETTNITLDRAHLASLKEFVEVVWPIRDCFMGFLTGHHHHIFLSRKVAGREWQGKSSDEWLADKLGCEYLGTGASLYRMAFHKGCVGKGCHHPLHLDVLSLHGSGGAQTPGGRVQKRIRFAEIAPTAHLVISGHDNAKLAYPRSGLDFDHGKIKRYVIGSGSFQRAYLDDEIEAGYAEKWGLVPAELGVTVVLIQVEQRHGKWRVDYHCSV